MAGSLTTTDWKDLCNDIENSKALFSKPIKGLKESYNDECEKYHNYIRGIFDVKELGGNDPVIVNDFWVNRQTILPNLYFQRPQITATARFDKQGELTGAQGAENVQAALNYFSRELDDETVFERCISDGIVSFGVHMSGWEYVPGQEKGNLHEAGEVELPKREIKNPNPEWEDPLVDTLTSDYLPSENYLPDPECTDVDGKTGRFCAYRYILPTKWVNKFFGRDQGKEFKGSSYALWGDPSRINRTPDQEMNLKRNEVIVYWDRDNQRVVYWVDDEKDAPARVDDWYWEIDNFPSNVITFNADNRVFNPIPDFRHIKQQVFEKIRLRTKIATLLRIMHQVWLADGRIASKLDQLLKGGEGRVVPVDRKVTEKGQSLNTFIQSVADFSLSDSLFAYEKIINFDIERISGISDYQRGLVEGVKRTATEIVNVSGAQNLKIEKRQSDVARWIIKINRTRLQLLQENANVPLMVKITNNDQVKWEAKSKADIIGEYDFDLDVSSMLRTNPEVKRTKAQKDYELMMNEPYAVRKKLVEEVVKSGGHKDLADRVQDPPPPPEPKPEPPRVSISLKAEDLGMPEVRLLLAQSGVSFEALNAAPAGGQEIGGGAPSEQESAVQDQVEAQRV